MKDLITHAQAVEARLREQLGAMYPREEISLNDVLAAVMNIAALCKELEEAAQADKEIGEVLLGGVDDSGEYEECEVEIPQRTLYSLQEQLLKSTLPMRLKLYVRIEPIAAIKTQGDANETA